MNRTQEVFWGSAWYFIGAILAAGVAYLTKLVLVRTLTVEEYGLFFAVFTFVLFFAVFKSLGIPKGLVRFVADYNSKGESGKIKSVVLGSAGLQLVTALTAVGVMWIFSGWLATHYFEDAQAKWLLRVVSFYLPLSIGFDSAKAILNGLKMNRLLASTDLVRNGLVLGIVIVSLYLGSRLYAPAYGYLLSLVAFTLVFMFLIMKNSTFWKAKTTGFVQENKRLILFSLPLTVTTVGALFISYFDTLMLMHFDTVVEVGVYNIMYPSAMLITMIGAALGTILLPVVTELWEKGKKTEIKKAYKTVYLYTLIVSVPAILVLMVLSEPLIRIFFGEEYLLGGVAFNVLLVGALFSVFTHLNYQTLVGLGESRKIMTVYIIGASVNVLLNFLLIPQYSLTGAAVASVISFFVMMTVTFWYLKGRTQLPWMKGVVVIGASLVIPLFAYYAPSVMPTHVYLSTVIGLVAGGVVYAGALYLFRIIQIKDIKRLTR